MSNMKRYLEDVYYNKILEGKTDELIANGMPPEEIEDIRLMFEEVEEL